MTRPSRLTPKRISQAKAQRKDLWISDSDGSVGFGRLLLRVTPSGTKRFYFRITVDGVSKTTAIGYYSKNRAEGRFTLSDARACAREIGLHAHQRQPSSQRSPDSLLKSGAPAAPRAEVAGPGSAAVPRSSVTVRQLCESYARHLELNQRQSAKQIAWLASRYVSTTELAELPADEVTPEQISDVLRVYVREGKRRVPSHVRSLLQAAYNHGIRARSDPNAEKSETALTIIVNPVNSVASVSHLSKPRKRSLTKAELGEVLRCLERTSEAESLSHIALRLALFLGGQRSEQLLRIQTDEVDLDAGQVTLLDGKGRRKDPRIHVLPLVPSAESDLQILMQRSADLRCSALFARGSDGKRLQANAVSRAARQICANLMKDQLVQVKFSFSDFRRTAETLMAELDISREIRAQIQSHGVGGIQEKHYDQYLYQPQKLKALLEWERLLLKLKAEAIARHANKSTPEAA